MKKIIITLLLCLSSVSYAQEEALVNAILGTQKPTSETAAPSDDKNPKNDTNTSAEQSKPAQSTPAKKGSDLEIKERISAVFHEIDDLAGVQVVVSDGRVLLLGDIANDSVGERAVRMAERFSGVAGVQDSMTRTLEVRDNVSSLARDLVQKAREFWRFLPMLVMAFLIFTVFRLIGRFIAGREWLWERMTHNPFVAELIAQSIRTVFWLIGIIVALNFIGAQKVLTTVLGGAGVLGIAVGFAVRDTIENYLASVMLSTRQPFRAGDHVVINGTKEGIVMRLTSRATILMTLEGNQLRVPNAEVFKGVILNYTTNPERRIQFDLTVLPDHTLVACTHALDVLDTLEFVIKKPKATATTITEGKDIKMNVRFWVNQTQTSVDKARTLAMGAVIDRLNAHACLPTGVQSIAMVGEDTLPKIAPRTPTPPPPTPDDTPPIIDDGGKNLLDNTSPRE